MRILLGSGSGADVDYPRGTGVAPRHAAIVFSPEACAFRVTALEGRVLVNGAEIEETVLTPGDRIELGRGGPLLRFRVQAQAGKVCKPLRVMMRDAREVGKASGLLACASGLCRDVVFHATWKLKIGAAVVLLMLLASSAALGGWLATRREPDVDALHAQIEAFQRSTAELAGRAEIETLRASLDDQRREVAKLTARDVALRRVLRIHSRGVCLLHGILQFEVLRQGKRSPLTGADKKPVQLEFVGSGFLAGPGGRIVTNRHVAQPWWHSAAAAPLLKRGFHPYLARLEAVFPGRAPLAVDPASLRLRADGIDVALLRVEVTGIEPLPLFTGDPDTLRGGHVVVLGYPTGVNSILARAERPVAAAALAASKNLSDLIAQLAQRKAITPVATQGALNEIRTTKLVYDAATTSGGSGGPVFGPNGEVIGVNYAIARDFAGTSFGIPIRYVRELLRHVSGAKPND